MAIVENAGGFNVVPKDVDQSKSNHLVSPHNNGNPMFLSDDQRNFTMMTTNAQTNGGANHKAAHQNQMAVTPHSINGNGVHEGANGGDLQKKRDDEEGEGFKREMRDLEEMLSKLNPLAEEFVPPSLSNYHRPLTPSSVGHFGCTPTTNNFVMQTNSSVTASGNITKRVYATILFFPLHKYVKGSTIAKAIMLIDIPM